MKFSVLPPQYVTRFFSATFQKSLLVTLIMLIMGLSVHAQVTPQQIKTPGVENATDKTKRFVLVTDTVTGSAKFMLADTLFKFEGTPVDTNFDLQRVTRKGNTTDRGIVINQATGDFLTINHGAAGQQTHKLFAATGTNSSSFSMTTPTNTTSLLINVQNDSATFQTPNLVLGGPGATYIGTRGNRIQNVGYPTQPADAATKKFVEDVLPKFHTYTASTNTGIVPYTSFTGSAGAPTLSATLFNNAKHYEIFVNGAEFVIGATWGKADAGASDLIFNLLEFPANANVKVRIVQ